MFDHLKRVIAKDHPDHYVVLKHNKVFISRTKGRKYEIWDSNKFTVGHISPRDDLVLVSDSPEAVGISGYAITDDDGDDLLAAIADIGELSRVLMPTKDGKFKQVGVINKSGHAEYTVYEGDSQDNLKQIGVIKRHGRPDFQYNVFDESGKDIARIEETGDHPNHTQANFAIDFGEVESADLRALLYGGLLAIDWFTFLGIGNKLAEDE